MDELDRARARAALLPAVARTLRGADFRGPANSPDRTVVLALRDDPMAYVFDHIRDAGGTAWLAMLGGEGRLHLVSCAPASDARMAVASEEGDVAHVHGEASVEMFVSYVAAKGTVVLAERRTAASIVDDGLTLAGA